MKPKSIIFHDMRMEIPVKNGEIALYYAEIRQIIYKDTFCVIRYTNNITYTIDATLKFMLDNLPAAFFRCNHQTIINTCYYKEYQTKPDAFIIMDNDEKITLSARRIKDFKEHKKNLARISSPCKQCYTCEDDCASRKTFCRRYKMKPEYEVIEN